MGANSAFLSYTSPLGTQKKTPPRNTKIATPKSDHHSLIRYKETKTGPPLVSLHPTASDSLNSAKVPHFNCPQGQGYAQTLGTVAGLGGAQWGQGLARLDPLFRRRDQPVFQGKAELWPVGPQDIHTVSAGTGTRRH